MIPILLLVILIASEGGARTILLDNDHLRIGSTDPDAYRTFTEIITSKGYPCESHYITTEDGYILHMFRIPYGSQGDVQPRRPILLQHGLLDTSFTWILNYPNESLSYILADAGYDVWMGNNRGNYYSTNHTTLSPYSKEFWQFTYDEMASEDLPAMINYVLNNTGFSNLTYIGHSEGTIQFFAGLIVNPSLAPKINFFGGLGPVATVGHIGLTVLRILADSHLEKLVELIFGYQFLPEPVKMHKIFIDFCSECEICCTDVVEAICGRHQGAFNESRMPVMSANYPGGTSTLNLLHWGQGVQTGKFQMYDFGSAGNMVHYNSSVPPEYNLAKFPPTIPVALYSGEKDDLADPTDVSMLVQYLTNSGANLVEWMNLPTYAHLDFVWDYRACIDFYPRLLALISTYNK